MVIVRATTPIYSVSAITLKGCSSTCHQDHRSYYRSRAPKTYTFNSRHLLIESPAHRSSYTRREPVSCHLRIDYISVMSLSSVLSVDRNGYMIIRSNGLSLDPILMTVIKCCHNDYLLFCPVGPVGEPYHMCICHERRHARRYNRELLDLPIPASLLLEV